MQVAVENLTKVQRRLTIVVPSQRVEQAFDAQLAIFAKNADIKGFRPGKVPLALVKQRFGQAVRSEAINSLIQETLHEAIQQERLFPINTPKVETKAIASADNSLEYTATFDVLPEIGTVNFAVEKLEKLTANITEQDIDQTVNRLREQHLNWIKVDRAAKENDKINGKIQMFLEDGTALTQEKMPLDFVLKDQASIFGWNMLEKLKGSKAGDEIDFSHTLPEDSFLQGMSGKTLLFKIEVSEIFEPEMPEMDQALVKKLGIESGDVNELRSEIQKQLELNLKRTVKGSLREKVFEKLLEQNPIEIPSSLVEREAKHLHDQNCQMGGQHGHHHSKEDEEYFLAVAKKRIQLGLLVNEYASKNKIEASPEKINEHIAEIASVYTDSDEYVRRIKADKRSMKEIETFIMEDQVVEKLLANVTLVEKQVTYDNLIKQNEDTTVT
ncbi:MAG TPA: trigger factor [Gammaproteobacteria bacterium]|nr:trigger factor [Gammaproteobacteria bacterium]